MDVICTGCSRHYKIDEEKLPSDSVAYFTCPNCKERIKIQVPSKKISLSPDEKAVTTESQGFESFEPGTKTALVYCPEPQTRKLLQKELTCLGYKLRLINQQDDIKFRFRYHIYDLILLYQNGPEPEDDLADIQKYISSLLMDIRRKILVVYIHPGGDRLDYMQSFSMGVDLTISPSELGHLSKILSTALETEQMTYKVFSECKAKVEEEVF